LLFIHNCSIPEICFSFEGGEHKLNDHKLSAKLLSLLLLLGLIAGVSEGLRSVNAEPSVAVSDAFVEADGPNGYGYSSSDSQGFYNITNFLDTGSYSVTASAPGFIDTTIENVLVTAGLETTNVNVLMPVSGGINGTITDSVSGTPLQNVYVSAVNETGGVEYGSVDITDASGNYEIITNLITGSYNVTASFASGHIMKEITGVSVTAGVMATNVNIALDRSATISGTVTDSVSMAALQDIPVFAVDSNGDYVTSAVTNSTGKYTLNIDLVTGTYNITTLYPQNHLPKTVSGVAVTAGSQYTVDLSLDPSGIISGRVTNAANGDPLVGASIVASSNGFFGSATTNDTGYYRITDGLGTGTYTVLVSYGSGYDMVPGVSVTQGSETSGVDVALTIPPSGTITGRVTNATGNPIEDASVSAEGTSGFGSDTTDSDGYYVINTGLETGTYTVNVTATGYVSQEQTEVNVVVDQVTADVDFQLAAAQSGRISGQILTEGTPIPDLPSGLGMLGIFAVATMVAIVAGKLMMGKPRSSKPV
jgi:hypothetical protein